MLFRSKDKFLAKRNLYGCFYRDMVRLFLAGEMKQAIFILSKVRSEKGFWKSIFYRRKNIYFNSLSGDNPAYGDLVL